MQSKESSQRPGPEEIKQAASKITGYFGGYFATWTIDLGIRSGLLRAISKHPEGITNVALAEETGLDPLYVDVWCRNAYGAELIDFEEDRYSLPPAISEVLLNRDSPSYATGTAQVLVSLRDVLTSLREWIKTGERIWWDTAPREFVTAVAESTRAFYSRLLKFVKDTPLVHGKLTRGGTLLEVGVGYGAGLIRFAEQYPSAKMIGVDGDAHSLRQAELNFVSAKMGNRAHFVNSTFENYGESAVADVALINVSLHEARDIRRATAAMYHALKPSGVIVVSEFPYPDTYESLRTPPARVMSGIQHFEAMIGDQLLSTRKFVSLLTDTGFRDIKTVELAPVQAVILGHK
jgi:ubiquinone/menaquinone biosynthesis C-methylase UbiE